MIPPLMGDLKLEISGASNVKISFAFRDYPKARRNKPMTRSESTRLQAVQHRISVPRENFVEAVVGNAGEGIYDVVVEPADDKPVRCALALKVYENSSKAKTKSLGTRVVKEKVVIARILMPEGIFWDDDASFSGNMEDSDSVTKYNADTGLIWKEYK